MKKIVFLTLAIVMALSLFLMSCGSTTTTTAAPPPTTSQAPATTAAPTTTAPAINVTTQTITTTAASSAIIGPDVSTIGRPAGGKSGGRLQLQAGLNINNIGDPTGTAGPSDAAYSFPVVEPLCIIDKSGNLIPWLASELDPAADGSSLTIKLRQGISFTDGTPFNADAAKYNIDDGINSQLWPNMKHVKQCVVIDNYTVRLDFVDGKWNWQAVTSLAGFWSVMMFSPTALQTHDAEWKKTHVIGTGPYILTSYTQDQKLTYDANPNYWRGKPYLDGVDYNIIADPTVALLAYKAGTIDILGVQPKDAKGLIDAGFGMTASTDMVFNLCMIPSSGNPNSILKDIRLRQAVEYAIDKQSLVDALSYGYGVPTNQEFCLPPYKNDSTVGYPFSIAKSKELQTAAGYPNGFTTTLYYVQGMPTDVPLALQGQLADAGITLNLDAVGYVQFVQMIQGGQGWDGYVYSYGFPGTTTDPSFTLGNGPLNAVQDSTGKWTVTTWDSCDQPTDILNLYAQSNQEQDPAKRVALIQQISKDMTDKYCMWTFFYYTPTLTSVASYVLNYTAGQYKEFLPFTYVWLTK